MNREKSIFNILKGISKQRVVKILQPGNIWLVENAISLNEENLADIQTCLMRGWIEVLHESIPHSQLPKDMNFNNVENKGNYNIYRLTESGWNTIYRSRLINLLSLFFGLSSVIIAFLSLG